MTDHTATEPPPLPLAVGAQVQRGVRPCAYRLRDAEAQSWLYYSDDELHDAAKAALSPLYDQAALAAVRDRCEKLRAFVQEVADHAFEHHQDYWAIRANEVLGPNGPNERAPAGR